MKYTVDSARPLLDIYTDEEKTSDPKKDTGLFFSGQAGQSLAVTCGFEFVGAIHGSFPFRSPNRAITLIHRPDLQNPAKIKAIESARAEELKVDTKGYSI